MFQGNRMSDGKCEQNIYYQMGKSLDGQMGKSLAKTFGYHI